MKTPVYLDYAASTPADPRVAEAMAQCMTLEGNFGNPASRSHIYGWRAEEAVEDARGALADLINADTREIVWTSGATESDNLAIKGAAEGRSARGRHIITARTEHKAVLDTCQHLAAEGFEISYIEPPTGGIITKELVQEHLRDDTILVSLMHVNNEIGVINEVGAIGQLCRDKDILFHVDAAQSVGKIEVDVKALHVDLLSISAHKMYGPKGIGALYVRRHPDFKLAAQIHGGGHERGMRSGTLPTHQIVGFGVAASIAQKEMMADAKRLFGLRERFLSIVDRLDGIFINGDLRQRVAGILNISFAGVEGETLLMSLRDLAVSTGSACTSVSVEPSYVLRALGVKPELAHSSLRLSFGRFTTEEEIDFAANKICTTVDKLREISPTWVASQV